MNPETGQKKSTLGVNLLTIAITMVWGTSFPMMYIVLRNGLGVFALLALRSSIAAIVLFFVFRKRLKRLQKQDAVICLTNGSLSFFAYAINMYGMKYTTPSMGAFITSSYVVFVPLLVWAFYKARPGWVIVLLSLLSFVGVVILTPFDGETGMLLGNALIFISAIFSGLHIVYLSKAVMRVPAETVAFTQICTIAAFSSVAFLIAREWQLTVVDVTKTALVVLLLGVINTAFCVSAQSYVQSKVSPEAVAIWFSMEGLFGCLFSIALGIERPTMRVFIGGFIILAAVVCVNMVQAKQARQSMQAAQSTGESQDTQE